MHACGHDTHMTTWLGTARRMAAMKDQWSGTLVMIAPARRGDRRRAPRRCSTTASSPASPSPTSHRLPRQRALPGGHDRLSRRGHALANVDSVDIDVRGVGGHGAYPHTTRTRSCSPRGSSSRCRPWSAARSTRSTGGGHRRQLPFGDQAQHHPRRGQAAAHRAQLHAGGPPALLDGIARIARGEAIAAGMPEDRMPVVTVREADFTPATFNTAALTERTARSVPPPFRRGAGDARPRRSWPARISAATGSPTRRKRKPDLLGRRRAAGALGRDPVATPPSCRRCTARSGRPTPKR